MADLLDNKDGKGFAALGARISPLPPGAWRDTSRAEEARQAALEKDRKVTPNKGRAFDDGTVAAAQARKRINLPVVGWSIVGLIFGLLVLVGMFDKSDRDSGSSSGATSYSTLDEQNQSKNGLKPGVPRTRTAGSGASKAPPPMNFSNFKPDFESKPEPGQDRLLSIAEVRFCKFNGLRIDTIQTLMTQGNWLAARKLHQMVDDHNARCSHFRYRPSDGTQTDADLAAHGAELREQSNRIVAQWKKEYESWNPIETKSNIHYAYKPATLKKFTDEPTMRTAELLIDDSAEDRVVGGKRYQSMKVQRYFDCSKSTYFDTEVEYYDQPGAQGQQIKVQKYGFTRTTKMMPVAIGSGLEPAIKFLCSI